MFYSIELPSNSGGSTSGNFSLTGHVSTKFPRILNPLLVFLCLCIFVLLLMPLPLFYAFLIPPAKSFFSLQASDIAHFPGLIDQLSNFLTVHSNSRFFFCLMFFINTLIVCLNNASRLINRLVLLGVLMNTSVHNLPIHLAALSHGLQMLH